MSEYESYFDLCKPPPPDRELSDKEIFQLTLQFVQSDFYRYVWRPRYLAEMELTNLNAMKPDSPDVRLSWLDRQAALWAIENAWFRNWLTPEYGREEKESTEEDSEESSFWK